MANRPSLDDYIDVAERVVAFIDKYPDGSLQTVSWEPKDIGGQTFIVYQAAAFRHPKDPKPGHGTAWEPFPGQTPYTKNSELMNAETAAWGRAIVACGITSNRKLASKQEVKARQAEQASGRGESASPSAHPSPAPAELASPDDVKELQAAAEALSKDDIKLALGSCGLSGVTAYNKVPKDKVLELMRAFLLAGEKAA